MRIIHETLANELACVNQVRLFDELYPNGLCVTEANLVEAANKGLNAWWAWNLLPSEGPVSRRAYALGCLKPALHLNSTPPVLTCVAALEQHVAAPSIDTIKVLSEARAQITSGGTPSPSALVATATALAATITYAGQWDYEINGRLFPAGYAQAGYATKTVALAQALSKVDPRESEAAAVAWHTVLYQIRLAQLAVLAPLLAATPQPSPYRCDENTGFSW